MHGGRHRGVEARRADRTHRAFELRKQGLPFNRIAERLGCGVGTVHRDVCAEIRRFETESRSIIDEIRQCEARRLDRLQAQLWERFKATDETVKNRLRTVDAILRIMERRAKLLGLDRGK